MPIIGTLRYSSFYTFKCPWVLTQDIMVLDTRMALFTYMKPVPQAIIIVRPQDNSEEIEYSVTYEYGLVTVMEY